MRSLTLSILLCLGPGLVSAAEKVDHEALCTYKKVSWEDFRGPVVQGQQVAWIASTIVVDPYDAEVAEESDGSWTARMRYVDVYALMDKLQSSARTGGRDDWNLAHEQLHFDITEIHARRLHARLGETSETGATETLVKTLLGQSVALAWEEEMRAFNEHQGRYDGETGHGTKKRQQKKWAELLAEELAAEEAYPLK